MFHSRVTMTGPHGRRRAVPGGAAFLLGVLALGALPSLAIAATYYVRSDGSDSNTGTANSAGSAWRTISKANTVMRAGDVVNVISLNPADTASSTSNRIAPSTSGNSGARITYIGDTANPARLGIPDITLNRSFITVTGFRSRGGADISSSTSGGGTYCVIDRCVLTGSLYFDGATNSRFSHSVLKVNAGTGNAFILDSRGATYQAAPSAYDTIRGNHMDFGTILDGGRTFVIRFGTNNCLVDSNRIVGTMDNTGRSTKEETYAMVLYECNAINFRYNKIVWDVKSTGYEDWQNGVPWNALVLRSGASGNSFYGDTLIAGVSANYGARISLGQHSAGATDPPWQTADNHWTRCVYKNRGGTIYFQNRFLDGSIDSCVFATTRESALWIAQMGNSRIRNNTFVAGSSKVIFVEDGFISGGSLVENNIFYSTSTPNCPNGVLDFDVAPSTGQFPSNHNLFYAASGSGNAATYGSTCSAVGASSNWCTSKGNDCNSLWSNPQFVNTNFDALDVRLNAGSPAIGRANGGGDLGAIVYSVDITAPGAITNLAATAPTVASVTLTWNASGDDGAAGTASSFDLRMSTAPINAGNFASATQVASPPVPGASGTAHSKLVSGLTAGQTYYFAIVVRDEAGNASPLGNVLQVTLPATDTVAPAAIQDLSSSG